MKKINLMPIAAAVFGLMLVFSQSAFKNKQTNYLFARQSNGVWINITGQTNYECVGNKNLCTVFSPTQPNVGDSPAGATKGEFKFIP